MHTFESDETRIHYNSDMSGSCIIHSKSTGETVEVPAKDILNFVESHITSKLVSILESENIFEILTKIPLNK